MALSLSISEAASSVPFILTSIRNTAPSSKLRRLPTEEIHLREVAPELERLMGELQEGPRGGGLGSNGGVPVKLCFDGWEGLKRLEVKR